MKYEPGLIINVGGDAVVMDADGSIKVVLLGALKLELESAQRLSEWLKQPGHRDFLDLGVNLRRKLIEDSLNIGQPTDGAPGYFSKTPATLDECIQSLMRNATLAGSLSVLGLNVTLKERLGRLLLEYQKVVERKKG